MSINTGIMDMNDEEILLGMYLQNPKSKYLVYQIRVRNNIFVLHTGGAYRRLELEDALANLVIIENANSDFLSVGANFFNSNLL